MSHHTVSVELEDKPGALARVSQMFARRGYNILSLAVGPTERRGISRLTLRVDCSEHSFEQIEKQMHKLVNVLRVVELAPGESVERELALITVARAARQARRADRARRGLRRAGRRHRPRRAHVRDRRPPRGARRVRGARSPARRARARAHRADRPAPAGPALHRGRRPPPSRSERSRDAGSDQDRKRRPALGQGRRCSATAARATRTR